MATHVKPPRALARASRWAEPGSKSAALFARSQGVLPGGNSRTTVYMAPYPTRDAFARLDELGVKLRGSLDDCFKRAGVPGRVGGLGSLFRLLAVDRELTDYRSTRTTAAEGERLVRIVRRLMELEGLVETFAAVLDMEGNHNSGSR